VRAVGGSAENPKNVVVDTGTDRVLISDDFSYFGRNAPQLPEKFRDFDGIDVCHKRGHKSRFREELAIELIQYIGSLKRGYLGEPISW
jgi:hypothetical protein